MTISLHRVISSSLSSFPPSSFFYLLYCFVFSFRSSSLSLLPSLDTMRALSLRQMQLTDRQAVASANWASHWVIQAWLSRVIPLYCIPVGRCDDFCGKVPFSGTLAVFLQQQRDVCMLTSLSACVCHTQLSLTLAARHKQQHGLIRSTFHSLIRLTYSGAGGRIHTFEHHKDSLSHRHWTPLQRDTIFSNRVVFLFFFSRNL